MKEEFITRTIIGCAYEVYNSLGFGFLESVYEHSLMIELAKRGIRSVNQTELKVYYEGQPVGDFRPDILVEDQIILEIKSIQRLAKAHELQLVNYLVATKRDIGLLLNFGPEKVEVKRKYRTMAHLRTDQEGTEPSH